MISLMNVVHLVQIGLAFLQTRLADVHEDHTNSGCSGQPTFSVETQFGVPALYMGCPICESVQCVLWFEYLKFLSYLSSILKRVSTWYSCSIVSRINNPLHIVELWNGKGAWGLTQFTCDSGQMARVQRWSVEWRIRPIYSCARVQWTGMTRDQTR